MCQGRAPSLAACHLAYPARALAYRGYGHCGATGREGRSNNVAGHETGEASTRPLPNSSWSPSRLILDFEPNHQPRQLRAEDEEQREDLGPTRLNGN